MKISVWDTYVKRENGLLMHFDILVPSEITDEFVIFNFGRKYLQSKAFKSGNLSTKECTFCHIEEATKPIIDSIAEKGFHIIEMEHCN